MKKIYAILSSLLLAGFCLNISAQDFLTTDASALRLQTRFAGGIEFSVSPSRTVSDTSLTPVTINIKAGYKFKSSFLSGILGIEYINGENFIPLGVEYRQIFSSRVWSPFAYAQTGYSLHLKRNIHSRSYTANYAQYSPAYFLKLGVGISYITSLSEFYFSAGYLYHQLEEIVAEQTGDVITDMTMNGFSLSLGFSF
jgi:hypothetical protein